MICRSLTISQAKLNLPVTIPLVVADCVSCAISHRIAIRLTHSVAPPLPNTTTLLGCVWGPVWPAAPFAQGGLSRKLFQALSLVPQRRTSNAPKAHHFSSLFTFHAPLTPVPASILCIENAGVPQEKHPQNDGAGEGMTKEFVQSTKSFHFIWTK